MDDRELGTRERRPEEPARGLVAFGWIADPTSCAHLDVESSMKALVVERLAHRFAAARLATLTTGSGTGIADSKACVYG